MVELKVRELVVFPWAEHNQGFLSVLALTAAIGFALFEHVRANRAEQRRFNEFVDMILEFTGELMDAADADIRDAHAEVGPMFAAQRWDAVRQDILRQVDVIGPTAPLDGKLRLAVQDLEMRLKYSVAAGSPVAVLAALAPQKAEIERISNRVRARRR